MGRILGSDLQALRKELGKTQSEMAEFINEQEGRKYDKSRISEFETGNRPLPPAVTNFVRRHSDHHRQSRSKAVVLAMANQKGGVGKTTTAINLGCAAMMAGHRVLIVDCDHQSNATAGLGIDNFTLDETGRTLAYAIKNNIALADIILPGTENWLQDKWQDGVLDVLAAGSELVRVEKLLDSKAVPQLWLRKALRPLLDQYDLIVLDCAPSMSTMSANALVTADYVVIPTDPEAFSIRGIPLMLDFIQEVSEDLNADLKVLGILPTKYNKNTNEHRQSLKDITVTFDDIHVFEPIPSRITMATSTRYGVPIVAAMPDSDVSEAYLATMVTLSDLIGL